jgi:hypothetical protein
MQPELIITKMPTGLYYCDKNREEHGDFMQIANISYGTLQLQWNGRRGSPEMRAEILRDARLIQSQRGEEFRVSTAGQTITLGYRLKQHDPIPADKIYEPESR